MDSEKQYITLHIGAHRVGLNVPREEEQYYREATKLLNERSQYYLQHYPEASAEMVWMYVALEMATGWQRDTLGKRMQPVEKKLKEMNERIEQVLRDSMQEETAEKKRTKRK